MQVLKQCNEELSNGASGESIVDFLRTKYNTVNSIRTRTNQIRNNYTGPLDKFGLQVLEESKAMTNNKQECDAIDECAKAYGRLWWDETDNGLLNEYMCEKKHLLLPENVRNVHITSDEYKLVKKNRTESLIHRHENALYIDGTQLIRHCETMLSDSNIGMYELILCLLVVSGRRTTELLNGKSEFKKIHEYGCEFKGQLKTKREKIYNIPLLVKYDVFANGLRLLKSMQSNVKTTNKLVSQTYQSGLGQHLHKHKIFGPAKKVHTLRGIYGKLVFKMFECYPYTEISIVQQCLGHVKLEEALAYVALQVDYDESSEKKICQVEHILKFL